MKIDMGDYTLEAKKIVEESYKIVQKFIPGNSAEDMVLKRCIIATGDPGIKDLIVFRNNPIRAGIEALRDGTDVVVDVEMVKAGINKKKLKSHVHVAVSLGSRPDLTRAADGILKLKERIDGGVVAIGNAPSAAIALCDLINEGVRPKLIIATPVGFINAAESKEMIRELDVPSITTVGTRGGSTLCVAIFNAILNLTFEDSP
jgi:precorrin isomerase